MTFNEIVKNVSAKLELPQVEVKRLMKGSYEILTEILDQNTSITIPDLGSFTARLKKERKSFNPRIGKFLMLPPKRIIRFRPSGSIKNELEGRRIENER